MMNKEHVMVKNTFYGISIIVIITALLAACVPIEGPLQELFEKAGGGAVYTVTFDSNGGSSVSGRNVAEGGTVSRPSDPTKPFNVIEGLYEGTNPEFHFFEGWYNGEELWDFSTNTVTGDITLTAHWLEPVWIDLSSQSGSNIVGKSVYYTNTNPGTYTLVINNDYSVIPQTINNTNLKLTIIALNEERTIRLSTSQGTVFNIGAYGQTGIELNLGNNVTLAGVAANGPYAVVRVETGAVFTMTGTSKISGNKSTANGGGVLVNGGTFNMNGGSITNNTAPSGGGVYNNGVFNMTNGSISKNIAYTGCGVYTNGNFSLSGGGSISENISGTGAGEYDYFMGGGVYVNDGSFNMTGGSISDNVLTPESEYQWTLGGGVYIESGSFTFNGGIISGNKADSIKYNDWGYDYTSWSLGGGVYISSDGNMTMDGGILSGNTANDGGGINLRAGCLVINKGTISGNIASTGGGISIAGRYCDFTMNGGDITYNIANGDSDDPEDDEGLGGGVYAYGSSGTGSAGYTIYFTMNGGNISNNIARHGGGVFNRSCEFTMTGGNISSHTTEGVYLMNTRRSAFIMEGGSISGNGGVGVYVGRQYARFEMNNGAISNNKGGVYVARRDEYYSGTFNMNGGVISGNTTEENGAGVCCYGEFEMVGGTISGNKTTGYDGYGGGVYIGGNLYEEVWIEDSWVDWAFAGGSFYMTGGTISGNTSKQGGGVYIAGPEGLYDSSWNFYYPPVYENCTFIMEAGTISGNKTEGTGYRNVTGGGVFIGKAADFEMSSGTISDNNATRGGGVAVAGNFWMRNGTISGNTSINNANYSDGAGVYIIYGGSFTMDDGKIFGNDANSNYNGYGGGVYIGGSAGDYSGASCFTMNGGEIYNNEACYGGGVYTSYEITFTMHSGKIYRNTATQYGGGVYVYFTSYNDSSKFVKDGGAIHGYSGSDPDSNMVKDNGQILDNMGHAVYHDNYHYRDSTSGSGHDMSCYVSGGTVIFNGWND